MNGPAYRRMIAALAESGGVSVVATGPLRVVTALNQTPETFPKATYADLGARRFRANPARQTVSFDVDVNDAAAVATDPRVTELLRMTGGRIELVEWDDDA